MVSQRLCDEVLDQETTPSFSPRYYWLRQRPPSISLRYYWLRQRPCKKGLILWPETTGTNMVVDMCKRVHYMNWTSKEAAFCEENMRGIWFEVCVVVLLADTLHRGGGQAIRTDARRVIYASLITAKFRLLEPVYLVEFQAPENALGDEIQRPGTPLYNIKSYLPVVSSFGFSSDLRAAMSGQAYPRCVFDYWDIMPAEPLQLVLKPQRW
ncbi:hypothetical protein ACHQM5_025708 [Ranunculus cassubicifolius]